MDIQIKESSNISSAISLARKNPHYFNPEGLEKIKKDLETATLIGAYAQNTMVGFVAFKELNDQVVQLAWIAIDPTYQNQGIGTRLIKEGLTMLPRSYTLCETKTLSETDPDPQYAKTRNFYKTLGFVPLETIHPYPGWGNDNPCQIFVKVL